MKMPSKLWPKIQEFLKSLRLSKEGNTFWLWFTKKFIFVLAIFSIYGCGVIYHNYKTIKANGEDVLTPYGKVKGADVSYNSELHIFFPTGIMSK